MQFSSQDLLCIYPLHAEVVLLSHSRIKLVDATLTSAESCLPHCDSALLSGCELENKKSLLFFSFAARAAALAVCQRAECVPKKNKAPWFLEVWPWLPSRQATCACQSLGTDQKHSAARRFASKLVARSSGAATWPPPLVSVSQVTARRASVCRTCCRATPPTSHLTRRTPTPCCTASWESSLTCPCCSRWETHCQSNLLDVPLLLFRKGKNPSFRF